MSVAGDARLPVLPEDSPLCRVTWWARGVLGMSTGARCCPLLPCTGWGYARETLAWEGRHGNAVLQAKRNPASHKMAWKTPRSLVEQNGRV